MSTFSLAERVSHSYGAFGLGIRSELELPELVAVPASVEQIEVRQRSFEHPEWRPGLDDGYHRLGSDAIAFPHQTAWFRLRDAREVTIDVVSGADPALLRLVLLGRGMGALLQWRGLLALHACALAGPRGAIVVMGPSGAGKSTTAAAFIAAGYPILSDEVVAVDFSSGDPVVPPGYATLRLRPESLALVGLPADPSRMLPSPFPKLLVSFADRAHTTAEPIDAVCFLDSTDGATSVDRPGSQEALRAILGNSYAPRLIGVTKTQALHLTHCSTLASARVLRVAINRNATGPADVVGLIEREIAQIGRVHGRS